MKRLKLPEAPANQTGPVKVLRALSGRAVSTNHVTVIVDFLRDRQKLHLERRSKNAFCH